MKRTVLAVAGVVLVGTVAWVRPAGAAAASQTFGFSGAFQTYVVPAGVTRLRVQAWGAQGGIYDESDCDSGGLGGYTQSDIDVAPGETLRVYVGGRGSSAGDADIFAGGFNGGGSGAADSLAGSRGGGGASDVRRAPFQLDDRLVVAGGGGGAGSQSAAIGGAAPGGAGIPAPQGGGGGTAAAGGGAGAATGNAGTDGTFGVGGDGGNAFQVFNVAGGGGGGGWYGGGGGGHDGATGASGGGGAGSSFGPPGSVFEHGVNGYTGQCNRVAKHGRVVLAPTPRAGTFHPLDPRRILDTREGLGAPRRKLSAGTQIELQVTGRGGVPSTGVGAVALNLTVDQPEEAGYITAWPCGVSRPATSNGNYAAGHAAGSAAIVPIGDGGRVCLYTRGPVHLIADVSGWYTSDGATSGARYTPVAPRRLVDTRHGTIVDAGGTLRLSVLGQRGLPTAAVGAVTVNITVTEPEAPGYVSAYPCGQTRPTVSNVNYVPGQTVANLATVKVGSNGQICLYTKARSHLVVDVAGWYGVAGGASGALITSITPDRILDSRVGLGTANQPIPTRGEIAVVAAGWKSIPTDGVSAVVLSVAATNTTGPGFLTFYPCDVDHPTASNVNYAGPGETVANLVVVRLDAEGKFCVFSSARTDEIADVAGYLAG